MAEKKTDVNKSSYLMISNIPSDYHSADLRNYFSQFLETGGFKCFHFRHRPKKSEASKKKCCCVIRLCSSRVNELFRLYSRKHWLDKNGDSVSTICIITRIRDVESVDDADLSNTLSAKYMTNKERLQIPTDRERFTISDLHSLPELRPPAVMPNGNVGTPTLFFLDSIKQCRLPPSIIGKLGLTFPKTRARRIYSCVPFNYHGETMEGRELDDIPALTASGHEIVDGETEDTLEGESYMIDSRTMLPERMESVDNSVIINTSLTDRAGIDYSSGQSRSSSVSVSCDGSSTSINMPSADSSSTQEVCIHKDMSRVHSICALCSEPFTVNTYNPQMMGNCSSSHETTFSTSTSLDSNQETSVCSNCKQKARTDADSCSNDQLIGDRSKKKTKQKGDKQKDGRVLHGDDDDIEERHGAGARSGAESEDDADSCEEWERHEALEDDPSNQERNKERLFEEEIELKWEKGGSGLVFYTDAQYWDQQEGDFDEKTTDDWDIDMSVYYEKNAGDKDARDFITMRKEEFLRKDRRRKRADDNDSDDGSTSTKTIGRFERYSKGFGRRLMEKSGWQDGKGLGSWKEGISIALGNEGQHPRSKAGFGYHGKKLQQFRATTSSIPSRPKRTSRPKRRDRQEGEIHISTAFDKPEETDPPEKLLRRNPPTTLKHR